jgi:hypothetical protein
MPSSNNFFSKQYFLEMNVLYKRHIDRMENDKISVQHVVICLAITSIIFGSNSFFDLVPRSFAIWFLLFIWPYVFPSYDKIVRFKLK